MFRQSKTKRKPTKIEDMTKEQIRQAIQKKRECNAKAQNIVENLLEKSVGVIYFLQSLPEINQCHFEDVIEERSIIHLCGYPICQNSLSRNDIPKQKYRISLKTNKVYDITTRKSFCSNTCYKAAMFIKKQMLTSPLWFREYEEIPKFHLLPLDSIGSLGQEIDVSIVEKIDVKNDKKLFTTINDFAQMGLQELATHEEKVIKNDSFKIIKDVENSDKTENELNINRNDPISKTTHQDHLSQEQNMLEAIQTPLKTSEKENLSLKCINEVCQQYIQLSNDSELENAKASNIQKLVKPNNNTLNIVGAIIEKPEHKIDPILTNVPVVNKKLYVPKFNKNTPKKEILIPFITTQVEKCLGEWFTLDSILFLLGEDRVKELIADKSDRLKDYMNNYANSIFYSSNTYDQYQQLCRKLNLLELEDKKIASETLQQETKPLPDNSKLNEESKNMQLKVKAFLAGETEILVDTKDITKSTEESYLAQLPLVDRNAQNALRRRIVCQHLNKVLPDLLRSLGLLSLTISSDARLLVNTFKLKANNIMFKPIQWTLIAIVIIKLLTLKNPQLEYMQRQHKAYQHLQVLLLSYKQDGGYLDRLVSWLTDINRILDMNDT